MVWLSAVDASTGATYYYDPLTQQTSWTQPAETAETVAADGRRTIPGVA